MTKRLAVALAAALAAAALLASDALAHGIVGREDLPIPRWLFGWAAVAVLVVSFVGLAVLWPQARLEHARERTLLRVPLVLEILAGLLGVVIFGVVVWAGYAGPQSAQANLTPLFVYVVFWNILPVLSLLFGDVFAAFNPWRAIGRAVGWIANRVQGESVPEVLPYPDRLGYRPAAVTIFVFAFVELGLRRSIADDPSWLSTFALAYAAVQLVGMALYGVERWNRHGDGFAVLFRLFGSLSPLHWEHRRLSLRPPLAGATRSFAAVAGAAALMAVVIGTTSFDGMRENRWWSDLVLDAQDALDGVGIGASLASELVALLGLLAVVLILGGLFVLGIRGMRSVDPSHSSRELARQFAPSLIPIALAYLIAHYFSQIAYQGQAAGQLASDPASKGWDLFGTANGTIDYTVVSANGIWYVQVGALVLGHVAGLVLAHDRALVVFEDPQRATRSQYWMLAVMVSFTSLGLWLLSAAS